MVVVLGILVVAAGAVLYWGFDRAIGGVDVSTVGVIVMAVGAIGLLVSLLVAARTSERAGHALRPLGAEAEQGEDEGRSAETGRFGRQSPW